MESAFNPRQWTHLLYHPDDLLAVQTAMENHPTIFGIMEPIESDDQPAGKCLLGKMSADGEMVDGPILSWTKWRASR